MITHDYTRREWGHDYAIHQVVDGGQLLRASGWGEGIKEGHYLAIPNDGRTTRYKVKAIEYYRDPPDMWQATLVFAPRTVKEHSHDNDNQRTNDDRYPASK